MLASKGTPSGVSERESEDFDSSFSFLLDAVTLCRGIGEEMESKGSKEREKSHSAQSAQGNEQLRTGAPAHFS